MRTALILAMLICGRAFAGEASPGRAGGVEAFAGRFYIEHSQGFEFLSGGYIDKLRLYSALWDEGSSFSLGFGYEPCPAFKAGIRASYCGFDDSGLGLDRLDTGSVRIGAALQAPLALESDEWFRSPPGHEIEGFVVSAALELGLHVVDTTWDALGRFLDRTFTYLLYACGGIEYRTGSIGLFAEAGISLSGPLRAAESYEYNPQCMLIFPVSVGLRIYI